MYYWYFWSMYSNIKYQNTKMHSNQPVWKICSWLKTWAQILKLHVLIILNFWFNSYESYSNNLNIMWTSNILSRRKPDRSNKWNRISLFWNGILSIEKDTPPLSLTLWFCIFWFVCVHACGWAVWLHMSISCYALCHVKKPALSCATSTSC